MWKHVAGFAGGFGVVLAMFMLAQRLSGYENKDIAVLVFRAAVTLSVLLILAAIWDVAHWSRNRKNVALPANCPLVVPERYGVAPGRISSEGLHVVNDGEAAFEVSIPSVDLADGWSLAFEDVHNRIGPKDRAFFRVVVSRGNDNHLGLDGIWRHLYSSVGVAAVLDFAIKYRDSNGQWYRSTCELHRDVLKNYPGFDPKFIRQEVI